MNYYVDPSDVIDYDRDEDSLLLFALFCFIVAGKTAKTQARLLRDFLQRHDRGSVRTTLEGIPDMVEAVKESRLGQYNRLGPMFRDVLKIDLRSCSVEDLEALRGCGPKTARMFLMFTRRDQRHAILDVHILKYLGTQGIEVPKSTPSGKKYRNLEEEFLKLVDRSGRTAAEFDLEIWKAYSEKREFVEA